VKSYTVTLKFSDNRVIVHRLMHSEKRYPVIWIYKEE